MSAVVSPLLLLLVSLCAGGGRLVLAWDYLHAGHDWTWDCDKDEESPIDIERARTVYDPHLAPRPGAPPEWINYDTAAGVRLSVFNTGHTAEVLVGGETQVGVRGAGSAGAEVYQLEQFHFHWGRHHLTGSEHTFDGGRHSPLELHLVHRNVKYRTLAEAIHHADGLAVYAVLYDVDRSRMGDQSVAMREIQEVLPQIRRPAHVSEAVSIRAFPMWGVLPARPHEYYRYHGSLTTPPCTESVTWTVFRHRRNISDVQLNEFRKIIDVDGMLMSDNHRPTQPVNQRTIYRSFEGDAEWPAGGSATSQAEITAAPRVKYTKMIVIGTGFLLRMYSSLMA